MIKHIVCFQLVEEANAKTKAEHCQIIKRDLEALKEVIPQIVSLEVGINSPEAPAGNFDFVINSEFASMQDLDIYAKHPEHQKVSAYIGELKIARTCVDYEI